MSGICNLCPNLCGADRDIAKGKCLAGNDIIVNRAALHFYEEPPISGTKGSGTIFFGGCTMRCVYCQNRVISRLPQGKSHTPLQLANIFRRLEEQGAHNINLVTPTHYSDGIKRALDIYRPAIPIVYNTSGYERDEVIRGLRDYIDIYLPDFKYSCPDTAQELSGRANYPRYALKSIAEMLSQKPHNIYDGCGIMQQGVIVRHLVLPAYLDNSIGVLQQIKDNLGCDVTLSLMSQFTPVAGCTKLPRPLKPIEYKAVVARAQRLGFTDIFIQELTSADPCYIPPFDTAP